VYEEDAVTADLVQRRHSSPGLLTVIERAQNPRSSEP